MDASRVITDYNTRAPKTTRFQYGIMVDTLEKYGQIDWEQITDKLNAASYGSGPKRTASAWRRVFSEWKCNVKKKARNLTDALYPQLSTLELRLLKDHSIVEELELSKIKGNLEANVPGDLTENVIQNTVQKDLTLDVTRRAPRTKPEQYEIMLRALELDDMNWQNLTTTLNSVTGGPVKTPEGWRRVFTEWKCNVKKRARNVDRNRVGNHNCLSETDKQLLLAIGANLNNDMLDPFELSLPSDARDSSMSSINDNIFKIKGEPFEDLPDDQNDFEESTGIISTDENVVIENFVDVGTNASNENISLQNSNNNDELIKKVDKINTNLEAINNTLIQLTGVLSKLVEKK